MATRLLIFRLLVDAWIKLKGHIVLCSTMLGLLFVSFQSGIMVGEKAMEEKETIYKQKENILLQSTEFEKQGLLNQIATLENQITYLKEGKSEYKEKIALVEKKYEDLVLNLQDMSTSYRSLEISRAKDIKEKEVLMSALANERPLLDYTIETKDDDSMVVYYVYNRSKMPLKVVETDYRTWVNGVRGSKSLGVNSIILYPDKNNIAFRFTHKNISSVKSGKEDWRGAACAKYTTLNKHDYRYWIYEIWFIYDAKNNIYNVVRAIDNSASSKQHCDLENMMPKGWIKH